MKFVKIGNKRIRADHVSAVEGLGLGPSRCSALMLGGDWISLDLPSAEVVALLEEALA